MLLFSYCVLTGFCTSETLCFTPFLSSEHLRTVRFCSFLHKVAITGGQGPGISPTVKRVIFPGEEETKSKDQQ